LFENDRHVKVVFQSEDKDSFGAIGRIIILITVYPCGVASLAKGPYYQRLLGYDRGVPEPIVDAGIGGFEVGLLIPDTVLAKKYVGRP
jgi:hypothetical protein